MVFLWISLYGLTHAAAQALDSISKYASAAVLCAYVLLLILWIVRSGCSAQIALIKPGLFSRRQMRACLPLLLLPLSNLVCLKSGKPDLSPMIRLLSAAIVEEIFFRGFLLQSLKSIGRFRSTLLTSLLFALMHIPGLLHGNGANYALLQLSWAFGFSLCCCSAVFSCNSLIPCITAHLLVNLTSLFSVQHISTFPQALFLWTCAAVQILIGLRLCLHSNAYTKEQSV